MTNGNNNIRSMQDLYRAVGRMEGKMDDVCSTVKVHDKRINRVETDVDSMKGKATVIGAFMGFVSGITVILLKLFLFDKK